MKYLFAILTLFSCCALCAQQTSFTFPSTIEECNVFFAKTLRKHIDNPPSLNTVKPDGTISGDMALLYRLGEHLENMPEDGAELKDKIERALSVLNDRRSYCYLLWIEQRLRMVRSTRNGNYEKCSQDDLIRLYDALCEINLSIVTENILAQEVATQMGRLYECLTEENKKNVRLRSIEKQMDAYTLEKLQKEIRLRKSPNDF